jgi:hypothetical protein
MSKVRRVRASSTVFWLLQGLWFCAIEISLLASGIIQHIAEGYLTFAAACAAIFSVAAVLSGRFRLTLSGFVEERRIPHPVEWAALSIMVIAGLALSNWIIVFCSAVTLLIKPSCDRVAERLRKSNHRDPREQP